MEPKDGGPSSVFERHRKKTLVLLVLVPVVLMDLAATQLLGSRDFKDFRRAHPYYHHGLLPGRESITRWGSGERYPVFTNSLGMLDASTREVPLATSKHRILFIGDSYTEGLGVPYPETFVGRLATRVNPERVEILNAAVISYCPKLYHLKLRFLLDEVGLEIDELYVFIDISDIQDEILYRDFEPGPPDPFVEFRAAVDRLLRRFSFIYRGIEDLSRQLGLSARAARYSTQVYPARLNYFWLENVNWEAYDDPDFAAIRDAWTTSRFAQSPWTQEGIRRALDHMAQLVKLARERDIDVTIGVYPWTTQVLQRDRDSLQVRIWREFSSTHGTGFIDLFPHLISNAPYETFEKRYILPGDAHWNAAGHALVAEAIWPYLEAHIAKAVKSGTGG